MTAGPTGPGRWATARSRSGAFFSQRLVAPAQAFVQTEAAGGAVVVAAALIAFVWANSPWSDSYFDLWHSEFVIETGLFTIESDLGHMVNDGLMVLFFFVVGLEVKREFLHGELAEPRRAALPVAAALGGMVVPALIYSAFNAGGDGADGWGIPMATDIAFALGVLALLGPRIPFALKVFLLTLAVVDDIGAIAVIAVFYTDTLSTEGALTAVALLAVIIGAQAIGIRSLGVYAILGFAFWIAVFESGIHATIAGVVLALVTPSRPQDDMPTFYVTADDLLTRSRIADDTNRDVEEPILSEIEAATRRAEAPLERLERLLHPWTTFLVVPLFALANAGVEVSGDGLRDAASSAVTLGIVVGLLVGKPVGVFAFAWLAVRTGIARLPEGIRWAHIAGVGMLAGIGFTVSLFITDLAFDEQALKDDAKIAILGASVVAAIVGFLALRFLTRPAGDGSAGTVPRP